MTAVYDASPTLAGTDDSGGDSGLSFRFLVKAAALGAGSGNQIQIAILAGFGSAISNLGDAGTLCYVGVSAGGANPYQMNSGTNVHVTFNSGSNNINPSDNKGSSFTGSISGTTLTVAACTNSPFSFVPGDLICAASSGGTIYGTINAYISGTQGGNGTYSLILNGTPSVSSVAMYCMPRFLSDVVTLPQNYSASNDYVVAVDSLNSSTTMATVAKANVNMYYITYGTGTHADAVAPTGTWTAVTGTAQYLAQIIITGSGGSNVLGNPPAFAVAAAVLTAPALAVLPIYLGDQVLSAGIVTLNTQATHVYVCSAQPANYAGVAGVALGSANPGLGNVAGTPSGRGVAVNAVNVTMTGAGTAACWAITDNTNSRLLASGPLSATQVVAISDIWELPSFTITLPN